MHRVILTSVAFCLLTGQLFAALASSKVTIGSQDTDGTTFTTASATPTGDALIYLMICSHQDADSPEKPSTITGTNWANGLSWTERGTSVTAANGDDGGTFRVTLYSATAPSSPTAGTVTGTFSSTHEKYMWIMVQWTDTATPELKQVKSEVDVGDLIITFDSAPDSANGAMILCCLAENGDVPPLGADGTTDYGELSDGSPTPQYTIGGAYITASSPTTLTIDSNSSTDNDAGFIVEIGPVAAGTPVTIFSQQNSP